MSVSVGTIYSQCCLALLEDNGFTLGLFTQQQFLDILGVVILDFTQRAALYKNIFTTPLKAGAPQYAVPDDVMKPELCFVSGKLIEKVAEADLTTGHFEWRKRQGCPKQWHEDNLAPKMVEMFPMPDYNGVIYSGSTPPIGQYDDFFPADRNLTMVGPAAPDITAWTILDGFGNPVLLQCVPDSFSHYLVYGVLEQVFSADSECRDLQRAAYCRARWLEAMSLADSIAREELLEDDD